MEITANEVIINGEVYIRKLATSAMAEKVDGMEYVICRTYSAGVFAGFLKKREGQEVVLVNARRIWYWNGAASLAQLATDGTNKPGDCKFPVAVKEITLLQAIEIIPCTAKAQKSIEGVPIWKK